MSTTQRFPISLDQGVQNLKGVVTIVQYLINHDGGEQAPTGLIFLGHTVKSQEGEAKSSGWDGKPLYGILDRGLDIHPDV